MCAWPTDVQAILRSSGASVGDALLSQAKESKSCMTTKAARVPLDLEEGIVGYDAVLAEIK